MSPPPEATDLGDHPWAYTSSRYRMVDLDFGIRSDHLPTARFLDRALAAFRSEGEPARWYSHRLVDDGGSVAIYLDDAQVLQPAVKHLVGVFLWHLNQRVMLETSSCLVLHAGVASIGGRAVVIPGRADAGKSTLVAALVSAGFDYLSDEGALVSLADRSLLPYQRALSLEPGAWSYVPAVRPAVEPAYDQTKHWLIPPQELGEHQRATRPQPGAIVFPCITPGVPAELRSVPRATAVRRLARHSTNLHALGVPGFEALIALCTESTCWELALDGVNAAVEAIRSLLTSSE